VRDRNRLIRRWGNMFYSNLLGSGCLPFLKSIVYMVIIFHLTTDLMINRNLSYFTMAYRQPVSFLEVLKTGVFCAILFLRILPETL